MRRAFAALLFLTLWVENIHAQALNTVNGIAAIVNDKIITAKDVTQSIRQEAEFLQRRYGSQPKVFDERMKTLWNERLEELVEHQLVLREFNTMARPLPESYVDNRVNEDIKKSGGRLTLMKTLQAEGITYESYRQRVKENVILQLMWNAKVPPDPVISPARIENFYLQNRDKFKLDDRVKLRMIVLTNSGAMGIAREIAKKLDEGAPFAEMAKIYSNASSASEGGDMGWVEKKTLREELGQLAFTLKPGKRSEPIELGGSVFLMMVEQVEPEHVRSLSEVRQEIEESLKNEETRRLRKQFVERLKKKAFVRYF
jgi:peptidyl-prolyl cis-trans isomerase SurA